MAQPDDIEVTVLYLGPLKQRCGGSEERLTVRAETLADVYAAVAARHGLSPSPGPVRAAVNAELRPWSTRVGAGDVIALLPPVSGG
jgi:molybdopterin converting factor small subunit